MSLGGKGLIKEWESGKAGKMKGKGNIMLAADNQFHSISIVPDTLFKRQ